MLALLAAGDRITSGVVGMHTTTLCARRRSVLYGEGGCDVKVSIGSQSENRINHQIHILPDHGRAHRTGLGNRCLRRFAFSLISRQMGVCEISLLPSLSQQSRV